jgi:hypothetical protein
MADPDFDDGSGNVDERRCPHCGSSHRLTVEVKVTVALTPDGTQLLEEAGQEWSPYFAAACLHDHCRWAGEVGDLVTSEELEGLDEEQ